MRCWRRKEKTSFIRAQRLPCAQILCPSTKACSAWESMLNGLPFRKRQNDGADTRGNRVECTSSGDRDRPETEASRGRSSASDRRRCRPMVRKGRNCALSVLSDCAEASWRRSTRRSDSSFDLLCDSREYCTVGRSQAPVCGCRSRDRNADIRDHPAAVDSTDLCCRIYSPLRANGGPASSVRMVSFKEHSSDRRFGASARSKPARWLASRICRRHVGRSEE